MSVLSGILGTVSKNNETISSIRSWQIGVSSALSSYAASSTKGMTGRIAGNKDWSGSYTAYGHTPAIYPGTTFSFEGGITAATGVTGNAIVDSFELTIDIASGAPISHTVNFSGAGDLSFTATITADASMPAIYPSIGCYLSLGTVAGAYTPVDNVKTITFSMSAANQSYVDSTSAGVMQRLAGTWDASLSFAVNTDSFANLPAVNNIKLAKIYVTSGATSYYWDLKAFIFGAASNLTVDRETAAIIGATLNAEYTGYYMVDTTLTEGYIKTPAAIPVAIWPAV